VSRAGGAVQDARGQHRDGIDFHDPVLEAAVRQGLEAVEASLRGAVASDYAFVAETSRHLVDAGGKRFRPLLVLLAAAFGDVRGAGVVKAATVVELTHLATLYHDDVMDEAAVRRGAPSANSRWDNTVAILTGDFLFARASAILADLGPEAVRIQARTFERLVTGQIRETMGPPEGVDPVDYHLGVVAEKTGSLIATCGRFGAMFGGAEQSVVDTLTAYGEIIGVAFQLSDDLLDIAAEAGQSGKTPGTDLREGIPTLPVYYVLSGRDPAEARLRELVARPLSEDDLHAEALDLLRRSAAMARARDTLASYAAQARDLLTGLPERPAKHALASLADFVVARTG
jgi:heptaprenyl diphosphate synthase